MTQYASLYALSRSLDYQLLVPPIDGFPNTSHFGRAGSVFDTPGAPYVLRAKHFIDLSEIDRSSQRTIATAEDAFLENIYNFQEHRSTLLQIFDVPSFALADYAFFEGDADHLRRVPVASVSHDDVVISLRLGDFVHSPDATARWRQSVYNRFLGFDYFDLILSKMRFERLFITSDEPFHPVVDQFARYKPLRVQNDDPLKTMALIRRFDRIAISESTFSWWAAYLSSATEIYFPISTRGLWGPQTEWDAAARSWRAANPIYQKDSDLYLRVDDERYKYVHQSSRFIFPYRDAPGKRRREDFLSVSSEQ